MNEEIFKSFLVALGFDIDQAGLAKFNDAVSKATIKVVSLFGAIQTTAAGVAFGITKMSDSFEQMGYEYRIIAPMINKTLYLRQQLLKAYERAGIDVYETIRASVKLNYSIAKTKFALDAIYKSVGVRFFELMTKQSDLFRAALYRNMPHIQSALENFVNFTFKAFEASWIFGKRVFQVFGELYGILKNLHVATKGWSTALIAAVAAFKLLNVSALLTPLGLIATALASIILLADDLAVYRKGGKSLFDWGYAIPIIDGITNSLTKTYAVLKQNAGSVEKFAWALDSLSRGDAINAAARMASFLKDWVDYAKQFWDYLVKITGTLKNVTSNAFKILKVKLSDENKNLFSQNNSFDIFKTGYRFGAYRPAGENFKQQFQNNTTININGGSPQFTAHEYLNAIGGANSQLARNSRLRMQ